MDASEAAALEWRRDADARPLTSAPVHAAEDELAPRKQRVVFIINSLTGGGAERTLVNLLNFARHDLVAYDIHLVLLDQEPERHKVNESVQTTTLDCRQGFLRSTLRLCETLKRLQPDLTVSFLNRANCANVIAARLLGFRCVISERVHTTNHFGQGMRSLANRLLVRLLYPLADAVIAVSRNVGRDLVENYGVTADRIVVIGNPISVDLIEKNSREDPPLRLPDEYIVSAGRLVPNKNFPLLIESYHRSGIGLPLVILGDGPARETLTTMVARLGIDDRVIMPGYVENPYPVIRRARFFVSSSNAEGFPNALVEAMALGCPVIATDCEAGPAEILDNPSDCKAEEPVVAKYGILVPTNSTDHLAKAMCMMAEDPLRSELSSRSRSRATDFEPGAVVTSYMNLLSKFLQRD